MRAALGVIVALVTMMVVVLALSAAPWFVLGVDAVLKPGSFDTTTTYTAIAMAVAALGGRGGGDHAAKGADVVSARQAADPSGRAVASSSPRIG